MQLVIKLRLASLCVVLRGGETWAANENTPDSAMGQGTAPPGYCTVLWYSDFLLVLCKQDDAPG